ncbi:hypothetical protein SAMN05444162_0326 [Paenibacillaceae bacterium GAS479]|nr:hypothetical protein SAMN05444162_0326 [Paenibacillaceae bacterium GAS479]
MTIDDFCEGIGLHQDARELIAAYNMDEAEYLQHKTALYNHSESFFKELENEPHCRQKMLYLFVRFAVDAYETYQKRGIDSKIYFDTFSDLQIWCMACVRKFGEYGIAQYDWLKEHVQLKLFRLGRLQFQPIAMSEEVRVDHAVIEKQQIVLNVHIPEGEPLLPHEVEASFEAALTFFRGITPVFICQSWLLYPGLTELLGSQSNIVQFQNQFEIYDINESSRQAENRIFHSVQANPLDYEVKTSLQRSAQAWLMSGRQLGVGSGIKIMAPL